MLPSRVNTEQQFEAALGLSVGVFCLVMAYRAFRTGDTYQPGDEPREIKYSQEPGRFVEQVMLWVVGGLTCLGFTAWGIFGAFKN